MRPKYDTDMNELNSLLGARLHSSFARYERVWSTSITSMTQTGVYQMFQALQTASMDRPISREAAEISK